MMKQHANNGSPSARKLGSLSIWKPPRSSGRMRLHSIPTASIPTSRRNSSRSGANTSRDRPAATFGFSLAMCPRQPETPCGRSTRQSWRFLRAWPGKSSAHVRTKRSARFGATQGNPLVRLRAAHEHRAYEESKHMNTNESTRQKPGLDDASSEPRPKNWAAVQAKRALRPSKEAILEAIKASNGNVSESARRLGVDRATLWRWMQEDEELMTFRNELREEK